MISINEYVIEPTIFPDGTSQVWKLPGYLDYVRETDISILWVFENEAEFVHLMQLCNLLGYTYEAKSIHVVMPYLPYARQDKDISNDATFALHTFLNTLGIWADNITLFDPHSDVYKEYFPNANIVDAHGHILAAKARSDSTVLCFPDKGAAERYHFEKDLQVVLGKTRDQQTGEITGMEITSVSNDLNDLKGLKVLIVDDLCDGGRTFIEAAKLLYQQGASEVNLYVSHGIFSKGVDILHKNGIIKVFTKDGLVSEKKDERAISLQKR